MKISEIIDWLGYWDRASLGPAIDKVHSFEDLIECRKWNRVMREGVFSDVTDAQLWDAMVVWRSNSGASA